MNPAGEGIGIGMRYAFSAKLFESDVPEIRWLEIHPENYVERGGQAVTVPMHIFGRLLQARAPEPSAPDAEGDAAEADEPLPRLRLRHLRRHRHGGWRSALIRCRLFSMT